MNTPLQAVTPSLTDAAGMVRVKEEIERCWPAAQAYWSRFLLLNDPDLSSAVPSVAQIQLRTRQVRVIYSFSSDRITVERSTVAIIYRLLNPLFD